ncbi:GNAT family N-acetyltransferase [Rhizobium sp. G187]|uniref:GNAT family N-acetyltransferase n=1 Tax=Rhizobium sp. G187 TaxID=3451352 RepID=UPI003EE65EE4
MTDAIRIDVVDDKDEAFIAATLDILDRTATAIGKPFDGCDLQIRAEDDNGELVGGLFALEIQGWLFVKYLAVAEAARNRGIGARLLSKAEMEAKRLGLAGVYLDTFSFQAPRFYLRAGYVEIGRLPETEGRPARIWFAKTFEKD